MERAVSNRSTSKQEGIVILAVGNEKPTEGPVICCITAVGWFY